MKALSTWQPWAGLIGIGAKLYETRSWYTAYRGPILIHAGKTWTPELLRQRVRLCRELPESFKPIAWQPLFSTPNLEGRWTEPPPLGCLIARAELVDCIPTEALDGRLSDHEIQMGNFGPCRFAWLHANVEPFDKPIPFRGRQGLFDVPDYIFKRPPPPLSPADYLPLLLGGKRRR